MAETLGFGFANESVTDRVTSMSDGSRRGATELSFANERAIEEILI